MRLLRWLKRLRLRLPVYLLPPPKAFTYKIDSPTRGGNDNTVKFKTKTDRHIWGEDYCLRCYWPKADPINPPPRRCEGYPGVRCG